MANLNAIQTLIDLCSKQSELEASRLGIAIKAKTEAQQKLSMLEEYRIEYINRLHHQLTQGINSVAYDNFNKFIKTLEQTIIQQRQIVQNFHTQVETHRTAWQESERERLSYNTLTKRAETAKLRKDNKRDQKQTYEFASHKKTNKY